MSSLKTKDLEKQLVSLLSTEPMAREAIPEMDTRGLSHTSDVAAVQVLEQPPWQAEKGPSKPGWEDCRGLSSHVINC